MRQITRKPRLIKRRNEVIVQLRDEGFFIDEIGEIVRLTVGRIHQILELAKGSVGKKK